MTLLIASAGATDSETQHRVAEGALADGADLVELRLDRLAAADDDWLQWARSLPPGRWIATFRSAAEGGGTDLGPEKRAALLRRIAPDGGGFIDFEFADWQRSADARYSLAAEPGPRVILSAHDFTGRPSDLEGLFHAIAAEARVVPKVAWMPRDICDNFDALRLLRSAPTPAVVVCMGEAGLMSRVLSRKVGAFATYCSPNDSEETAPGQVPLSIMLDRYRWRTIGASTRFFGVIGWPVAHSMSPLIHNAAFARAGIDAVYLPLAVDPAAGVLESFLDGCLANDWLDAGGFSVTAPHKVRVLAWLGQHADAHAQRIGAVNTLVVSDGQYRGFNTDCDGALDALTDVLACERTDLRGARVDVLGAGGAARAVVAGLRECGADVTLSNIIPEDANALADELGGRTLPWDRRGEGDGTILINCTSVGMWPAVEDSPFPPDSLAKYEAVFDVVYNPLETRLLRDAAAAGCRIVSGVDMFVNQAAAQFRLWTGRDPDRSLMRELVIGGLSKHG